MLFESETYKFFGDKILTFGSAHPSIFRSEYVSVLSIFRSEYVSVLFISTSLSEGPDTTVSTAVTTALTYVDGSYA